MSRILAIDYGKSRCGIAVSDPLQIIGSPLQTVATKSLVDFLKQYAGTENLDSIVVGEPKHLDNTPVLLEKEIQQMIKTLKVVLPEIPIHRVDERFTSKMAVQTMVMDGTKKKERQLKENIDKVSASLILQTYLELKSK